jgi:hypothetical protein
MAQTDIAFFLFVTARLACLLPAGWYDRGHRGRLGRFIGK